jgi:hypothetical protein
MAGIRTPVLLVQLPIPPHGWEPVRGNVPLAAAFLKLFARRCGLEKFYDIELLPPHLANTLGDQGLILEILARRPAIVGFTCYVWNVERSVWLARQLKRLRPELRVMVGGPEITPDNTWVVQQSAIDYAITGEGEPAFVELLTELADDRPPAPRGTVELRTAIAGRDFALDAVSSPYIEGILDLVAGQNLFLETVRGCRFHCKYCYYPKNCHIPRGLSVEQIVANLRYAVEHGAGEVFLLDPTLNQRPDFAGFLQLLTKHNPRQQLAFAGELRAEGIDAKTARLLRQANFREVEIGLQSVEPRAMLAEGIKVQVDLIVGLPGDTVDSVRRGMAFLQETHAYSEVQVFNLSILPGTAFRQEAERLGLAYQPWPPYYATKTPTLSVESMYRLMEEAQETFGIEFDPPESPSLKPWDALEASGRGCRINLDAVEADVDHPSASLLPPTPALSFLLWLQADDFHNRRHEAVGIIERLLTDNPHTTLQIILEPLADPLRLTVETLELLLSTCYRTTTYLDRYYSLHPGRWLGAKRLFVLPPRHASLENDLWLDQVADYATLLPRNDD